MRGDGASSDRIELRGIRAVGVHGLLPEERERPQPFEVDIDIHLDLRAAGQSDDLNDTVDYGAITQAAEAVITGPHADLIEQLAERIAGVTLGQAGQATGVTVTVRKLRPPVPAHLETAGVTIHRARTT